MSGAAASSHSECDGVLGGSIVGRNASELISILAVAVTGRLKVADIIESMLVHPTLAEALAGRPDDNPAWPAFLDALARYSVPHEYFYEMIEGVASVDESAITGESAPVIREAGGDRSAVTGYANWSGVTRSVSTG